ncbi:predicted protein [Phaeodactylum tricornutum CCAP 1055/1]|jgi:hypothetical protein|uniref:Uncharacterized protein n=1 Tax=Phaeodactylum tricornutum (strain CCAP 1055/1) TaxID=556484 RepID=B7FY59_PHATC|nr:predicted protein [Phaeodactylum tricornutum CCAP 1055/1]EEC48863.1 predicted protein [Phaeodactylum tricornutum CCAP 1055/1]|eukprot:XP_002179877.1 predicted protein [Phaeodactylum tricornutum CCAP 1055/1]
MTDASTPSSDQSFVTNPEQWLESLCKREELLCIVIFRGAWCKYDRHYLRKLGEHHQNVMKDDKTQLVAWTSQGAQAAQQADEEWGLTKEFGYDMVLGDETNALANWLKEDEILPSIVTATPEAAHVQDLVPDSDNAYPNGIVMPAMVWYAHHGNLVATWTASCEAPGYGGPKRPDPTDLYEQVLKRKHALDHGSAIMPVHGNELKMCTNDWEVTAANCDVL